MVAAPAQRARISRRKTKRPGALECSCARGIRNGQTRSGMQWHVQHGLGSLCLSRFEYIHGAGHSTSSVYMHGAGYMTWLVIKPVLHCLSYQPV